MPVNARRFVKKMRGATQAHLLEADDDNFYVVKFQNNPQHRRTLVNEWLAGEILSHLRISSPAQQIVSLSSEFLRQNPAVGMQTATRFLAVEPGWHFGSRHPGIPASTAIYDYMPDPLLRQVANAEQFLASLVFDRWVANTDARQSIFFRCELKDWLGRLGLHPRKKGFVALMIDHGFAFNGPNWDFPASPLTGLYSRRMFYANVRSIDDFDPWLTRVINFPEEVLDRALRQIPLAWINGDETALKRMVDALLHRRKRIPELIHACRAAPGNPFPRWVSA